MRFPRRLIFLSLVCGCLLGSCSSTPGESAKSTGSSPTPAAAPAAPPAPASPLPAASKPAQAPPAAESASTSSEPWKAFTGKLSKPELVDRFLDASRLLLGVPYINGPLGEGDAGGPDPE